MKIYIETLGCQMNKLDSELVIGLLRGAGHEITPQKHSADVVIYNTCSVRKHAEEKVLSRIGRDGHLKASGKDFIVIVIGCMAQRMGQSLRDRYPQVDAMCSSGRLYELPGLIASVCGVESRKVPQGLRCLIDPSRVQGKDTDAIAKMDKLDISRTAGMSGGGGKSFVRIMRGCDKFCSYCIVPSVRGAEHSRSPDDIMTEVCRLVDSGCTEITLIGQTVNSYCWPNKKSSGSVRFSDLLARVSEISGLIRLRFVTSHPVDFGRDILEAMRDNANICPYIHCPAQSGSDTILKKMNRGYTRADYDEFILLAREIVPDVVIAGDFIVGFPGETEDDHLASVELIRTSGYKNSFIFKYSPRPQTHAERKMLDDIPEAVKKRRNSELLQIQEEVSAEHHRRYIGQTVEVLVEGESVKSRKKLVSTSQVVGRTRGDHIVVFDGELDLTGKYIDVLVEDCSSLTLFGRTVSR